MRSCTYLRSGRAWAIAAWSPPPGGLRLHLRLREVPFGMADLRSPIAHPRCWINRPSTIDHRPSGRRCANWRRPAGSKYSAGGQRRKQPPPNRAQPQRRRKPGRCRVPRRSCSTAGIV